MSRLAPIKCVAAYCKLFLLFTLLFFGVPAFAATLSVSPSTGVYTAGGTFTASVVLNTQGKPVNAAEGQLKFNPKELSVVAVSRGSSIFNLWTQDPTFSNSAGTISFGGGSPSGYTGSSGSVMTVTFRALNAGSAKVNFANGSVLAADGQGTNILTGMNGGTYTISAVEVQPEPETIQYVAPPNTPGTPTIKSSTHPDQAKWYRNATAELSWSVPAGVTAIRTLLDDNSGSIPTKVYDNPISSITLEDLDEGVSYFHIQFKNAEGWGRVAHYRIGVDTKGPTDFGLSIPEGSDLSSPVQYIDVVFKDATSPLSKITVTIDGTETIDIAELSASNTFALPTLSPGKHSIVAEVFDAAGNSLVDTLSFAILAFDKPIFTDYPSSVNEGVIPVLKGLTRPHSIVDVTLQRLNQEVPTVLQVQSGADGQFVVIPDGALGLGVYAITAVAYDENGAQSEPSDPIKFAVQQPGYIQIGSFVVSILSIIVPLVALLFLLLFMMWFSVHKFRRFRGAVATESKEALEILHREFAELKEALHNGEVSLSESRKGKKLTKAETELLEVLHKEIDDSRERVEKEIMDVTSLTNPTTKK